MGAARSSTAASAAARTDDSAIGWFGLMLVAAGRGDYARAAHAQEQLAQLGWAVSRTKRVGQSRGRKAATIGA